MTRQVWIVSGLVAASAVMLPSVSMAKATDYKGSIEVVSGENTNGIVEGYVFVDKNRNSTKEKNENGIRGVLVSNGQDVVVTDAKGYYEIAVADGQSLFVTKPAGFEVPTDDDNMPQFFYHHLEAGSPPLRFGGLEPTGPLPVAVNFPMIKSAVKKSFKIAVSGDPQPYTNTEVSYVRDTLGKDMAEMDDLELVIVEGDVMGDDLDLYPRFKDILSVADVPQYYVGGNHDLDFDATSDAHSFDTFKREFGPAYYSFDIGDVHFVVLDNVRYPCTPELDNADGNHSFCDDPVNNPTYNGVVDDVQMQWLANDLAHVDEDKLVVLNLHIPLVSFIDKDATKHQTDNVADIYALIEGRPALALSGHTHTLEQFLPGEYYEGWEEAVGVGATPIPQIIAGAAAGSWWSGNLNDDNIPMAYQRLGAPRGFLVIEFNGNTFEDQFKATGKPMDKQLTVDFLSPTFNEWYESLLTWMQAGSAGTPPANINELPDTAILTETDISGGTYIIANVWNGTRDSKVMAKIDDGEWVTMARTQQGAGEGHVDVIDPYAIRQQMYVFRYAARSTTGTSDIPSSADTQGFRLFGDSQFGPADPQPLPEWMLADQSNHLWAVELPGGLSEGSHKLTVKTQDRFGREFNETKLFEVRDVRPPTGWNGDF